MFQVGSFMPMVVYAMFYFTLDCPDCEGDTQEEVGGHCCCSGKLHLHVYPIYFCYAILIIKVGMHGIVLFC
jgi:hypothetical protein